MGLKRKIIYYLASVKHQYKKLHYKRFEKLYHGRLTYLYYPCGNSRDLLVIFSAFTGVLPKYNYTKTLKDIKCNRLYILDNFGYNRSGGYYLGEHGDYFVPDLVIALINDIKMNNRIEKITTLGSSKGGTAALYYGLRLGVDRVIVGAPQYYLGDYLNTEAHRMILEGIIGNVTDEKVTCMNILLYNLINRTTNPVTRFYIHCSRNEHTYDDYVRPLVDDLRSKSFFVDTDLDTYISHSDVGIFFPNYFKRVLSEYYTTG